MDPQGWKNDTRLKQEEIMPTYQPGIPTGSVPLSLDYTNIQGNFEQLNTVFGVDHLPFSNVSAQLGYHTDIHFNPVSTTSTNAPNNVPTVIPPTVAGFGQLFSAELNDGYRADNSLLFLTGTGRLSQLTANFRPSVADNFGRTYLPGPGASSGTSGTITMQWGFIVGTHGGTDFTFRRGDTGNVAYDPEFPNSTLSIWTQLGYRGINGDTTPTSDGTIGIRLDFDKTGFTWLYSGSSESFSQFLWVAIGT